MDIDNNGVVWVSLASGHLASFDRGKCKGPLNGPTATGKHCPEGWTLYPYPGPQFKGVTDSGSAEASYYTWVDQYNTFGLGANVPISTGNGTDALLALVDGKFIVLRVPYPMGFYAKGMDGRIDDPNAGGRTVVSGRPMAHERRSMPRAGRARRARSSIFSCVLIRLRDDCRSLSPLFAGIGMGTAA